MFKFLKEKLKSAISSISEGVKKEGKAEEKIVEEPQKEESNASERVAGERDSSRASQLPETRSQLTGIYTTGSRAIGCLGIADDLEKAEKIAEQATKSAKGKLFHRKDIGTKKLIEKRVRHMKEIQK